MLTCPDRPMALTAMVHNSARVSVPSGSKVVLEVPETMPSPCSTAAAVAISGSEISVKAASAPPARASRHSAKQSTIAIRDFFMGLTPVCV